MELDGISVEGTRVGPFVGIFDGVFVGRRGGFGVFGANVGEAVGNFIVGTEFGNGVSVP